MPAWIPMRPAMESRDWPVHTPVAIIRAPAFDARLVDRLAGHHAALLNVVDGLAVQARIGRYSVLRTGMAILRRFVLEHLLEEEAKLYPYLLAKYADDRSVLDVVVLLRAGAKAFERTLEAFMRRYERADIHCGNLLPFLDDLAGIRRAMQERFQTEEQRGCGLYRERSQAAVGA